MNERTNERSKDSTRLPHGCSFENEPTVLTLHRGQRSSLIAEVHWLSNERNDKMNEWTNDRKTARDERTGSLSPQYAHRALATLAERAAEQDTLFSAVLGQAFVHAVRQPLAQGVNLLVYQRGQFVSVLRPLVGQLLAQLFDLPLLALQQAQHLRQFGQHRPILGTDNGHC